MSKLKSSPQAHQVELQVRAPGWQLRAALQRDPGTRQLLGLGPHRGHGEPGAVRQEGEDAGLRERGVCGVRGSWPPGGRGPHQGDNMQR